MKKFLSVLLAVAMVATAVFAVVVPASAADQGQSYLQVNGIEGSNSRTENQLNIVAPIAADDVVTIDFRPVGDATYDGGIFDVRTHDSGRKLFFAKPSSSEPGTWSVSEQTGADKNNGTVDMETATITVLEDGWLRASFEVTEALADGLHMSFGYIAVEIDNLTIGTKICSFNEANVVEFADENEASLKFDDGTEFTIEQSVNGFDWVASLVVDAEAADTVPAYAAELNSNDVRSGVKLTDTLAEGDVLSFYVKVVPGEDQDLETIMAGLKLYVRGNTNSDNKAYYIVDDEITNKQAYSSKLKEYSIDCGDGWYFVEVSIPAADSYFLNLNAEDVDDATLGDGCMYADICVNGTPVTTVLGISSGDELVATQITEPVIPVTEPDEGEDDGTPGDGEDDGTPGDGEDDGTPGDGEDDGTPGDGEDDGTPGDGEDDGTPGDGEDDETEDVEPTGAISVAVVAIVAVIGGAVVLKKREF